MEITLAHTSLHDCEVCMNRVKPSAAGASVGASNSGVLSVGLRLRSDFLCLSCALCHLRGNENSIFSSSELNLNDKLKF